MYKASLGWIVEPTFARLNNARRLSKAYEITTSSEETGEACPPFSGIRTDTQRLAKILLVDSA